MSLLDITFGAAIPDGWTASSAIAATESFRGTLSNPKVFADAPNLLDGVDFGPAGWPPRWQGERGACNAFAVTAMEELHFARTGDGMTLLSPEFLYARMRAAPAGYDTMNPSDAVRARMKVTGGTFLHQAVTAINAHGIATEEQAPYDPYLPPAAFKQSFSKDAEENAKERYRTDVEFRHDVATSRAIGEEREWHSGNDQRVSVIVAEQLGGGCPVAASFAILEDAEYVWLGELAQVTGEVRYPDDDRASGRPAVAGHAICIVGFIPAEPPTDLFEGWFVFRNSLGVEEFGAKPHISPRTRNLPGPGYGIISTADVDRYCWEYLSRKAYGGVRKTS